MQHISIFVREKLKDINDTHTTYNISQIKIDIPSVSVSLVSEPCKKCEIRYIALVAHLSYNNGMQLKNWL